MFGQTRLEHKLQSLEAQLEECKKRLAVLESDCAPFMVGEVPAWQRMAMYLIQDQRPRLSLHQVAQKIMQHCGLTFDRIAPTPEVIVVKKTTPAKRKA